MRLVRFVLNLVVTDRWTAHWKCSNRPQTRPQNSKYWCKKLDSLQHLI